MEVSVLEFLVALAVTVVAAGVQAAIGFGFAVISIPVLALVNPQLVPAPQLLVSFPLAWLMMRRERAHIDLTGVRWILVGRVIGGVATIPALVALRGEGLELAIGVIVLVLALAAWSPYGPPMNRATQIGAGAVSGATGLLASMGGPPLAILYRNATGSRLRSSLAAVFIIGLTLSLVLRLGTGEISLDNAAVALVILPGVLAGYVGGARLAARVDRRGIRHYVLGGSIAAAGALIIKSIF